MIYLFHVCDILDCIQYDVCIYAYIYCKSVDVHVESSNANHTGADQPLVPGSEGLHRI